MAAGSQWWDEGSAGVPDSLEPADFFGGALAAGDIDGDGRADLAIGASNETINKRFGAGAVTVFRGAPAGLTTSGIAQWHQDSPGVPGVAEGDGFGTAVALGDVNGDRLADLIVGSPSESIGAVNYCGSMTVLYGRRTMLTGTGALAISQNSAGVPGANEDGDWFGSAVHTMRAPGKAYDSVVVASLNEGVERSPEDGRDHSAEGRRQGGYRYRGRILQ